MLLDVLVAFTHGNMSLKVQRTGKFLIPPARYLISCLQVKYKHFHTLAFLITGSYAIGELEGKSGTEEKSTPLFTVRLKAVRQSTAL